MLTPGLRRIHGYRIVWQMYDSPQQQVPLDIVTGFSMATRVRGTEYADRGRVELTDVEPYGLIGAMVRGTHLYDVWLLFDSQARRVIVNCDCPVGCDEIKCKHAWAALVTLAREGVLSRLQPDGGATWTSEVGGLMFEDDVPGAVADALYWLDPDAEVEVFPRRGRSRTIDLAQNRPFGEDERDVMASANRALGWAERVDRASRAATQPGLRDALRGAGGEKPREYFFGLWAMEHDPPRLGITVHSRRRDGKKSKRFRGESATEALPWNAARPTPEDARALAVLRGAALADGDGGSWRYESKNIPVTLESALAPVVLETLCATGRCHLMSGGERSPTDGPRVYWGGRDPWIVRLNLAGKPGDAELTLAAELARGEEAMACSPPSGAIALQDAVLYPRAKDGVTAQTSDQDAQDATDANEIVVAPLAGAEDLPWLHLLGGASATPVPADDAPALIAKLFAQPGVPALRLPDHLAVRETEVDVTGVLRVMRPDAAPHRRGTDEVLAEVAFAYGDEVFSAGDPRRGVVDADARTAAPRRFDEEQRLTNRAARLGEPRGRSAAPEDDTVERDWVTFPTDRLSEVAEALTAEGWRVEADNRPLRIARGDFSLSVSSGIDWFDVKGEAAFGDQTLTLADLLGAVKTGERFVTLGDGSAAMLPERWLDRYAPLAQLGEAAEDGRRMAAGQVGLLDALLDAMPEARFDRSVATARKHLAGLKTVGPKAPPRGFVGELRDYQRLGLGWLDTLAKLGLNGCLADDMGLGKTIQVLAWLEARRAARGRKNADPTAPRTSLIVVPRSLIDNWQREAERFTPKLRVRDHTGPQRWARVEHGADDAPVFDGCDVLLTTYGTLRRDAARLAGCAFDVAVLDEAQAIKNPKTAAAKASRLINARHRLAVSGTPVENHLGELVSLFDFLNPGMLDGATGLLDRAAQAAAAPTPRDATVPGSASQTKENPELDTARVLSRAVSPFVLRRTKTQVAPELPARQEETLYCTMEPKQAKYYERLAGQYRASLLKKIEISGLKRSKIQVLEALLRLRQAACHPALVDEKQSKLPSAKLEMLFGRLDALREQGAKVLVFSQFVKLLSLVRQRLDADGVPYAYLDGRTRKRQDVVDRFQSDPDCPLMLISLKAGGTGLNLTAAEYVFLLDPWWNPAVEAQAIDRAHRIGQTRTVFASRLITRNTVEEKVLELQQSKRNLADAILGDPASVMKSLSLDDLKVLLG